MFQMENGFYYSCKRWPPTDHTCEQQQVFKQKPPALMSTCEAGSVYMEEVEGCGR